MRGEGECWFAGLRAHSGEILCGFGAASRWHDDHQKRVISDDL